jgi:septation ring formation regulator EzrA
VAVYEYRYDVVLDASTSIIMIEMPFLRLREEIGKLRTAMEKASKEYDQEKELYAGLQEELERFETMLSSTVTFFQSEMNERRGLWQNSWEGYWTYTTRSR